MHMHMYMYLYMYMYMYECMFISYLYTFRTTSIGTYHITYLQVYAQMHTHARQIQGAGWFQCHAPEMRMCVCACVCLCIYM